MPKRVSIEEPSLVQKTKPKITFTIFVVIKTDDNSGSSDNNESSDESQKPLENDDVRIDSEDKSQDSSEKEDK